MEAIFSSFDRAFAGIHSRSRGFIGAVPDELLFEHPRELPNSLAAFSCGEYILRSAAMVEKTFGGLTARLWDDPFEWTLPEKLSDAASILGYLNEVEEMRQRGFTSFTSDADLTREIPAPERLRVIADVLIDTIGAAEHYQGRAFAVFQMLSNAKLPRR